MILKKIWVLYCIFLFVASVFLESDFVAQIKVTRTPTRTMTATYTNTATFTLTPSLDSPTITDTPSLTLTPTDTPTPTTTFTPLAYTPPYLSAPLCQDTGINHPQNEFHTLWNGAVGCHYDHEHGTYPFTDEVANTFPEFDLYTLLGNVEIGHTNPSSPMENTHKHGGFKWQVILDIPGECQAGFESAEYCVESAVIQIHSFGDASVELETTQHSSVALLKVCDPNNPSDCGYAFFNQLQEYGQRVTPYQGFLIPYPNTFQPSYDTPRGPYWTIDCVYASLSGCRSSLSFILQRNANSQSTVSSKPTGGGPRPETSSIFRLLFRIRDNYQVFDSRDTVYPFTYLFICSDDGGQTYNPTQCRYNNSTAYVQEIAGNIPSEWDNLNGFDVDPRVGRITADGYVTRFGELNMSCIEPGVECHPIKLTEMFVGYYGDSLIDEKTIQLSPVGLPERDVYFCGNSVCSETSPGAVPSGWIGESN